MKFFKKPKSMAMSSPQPPTPVNKKIQETEPTSSTSSDNASIVLLRWTPKAQQNPDVRGMVEAELINHGLDVTIPKSLKQKKLNSNDTLLLSASQETLEMQAERDGLIKPRLIEGLDGQSEIVLDHFRRKHRGQFVAAAKSSNNNLFSASEKSRLILGLLDDLSLSTNRSQKLLRILTNNQTTVTSDNLGYLLQHEGWINVLTPLHNDETKSAIHNTVCYPLSRNMPPRVLDDLARYYGISVAFYFAFQGFLARWLLGLGFMGLSTFLWRVYRQDSIDEDQYTPFYGLACFLWAVLLVRFWEQEESLLAQRWGTSLPELTTTTDDHQQHRRPAFKGIQRISPVTGKPELYFPPYRRKLQYLVSGLVTSAMLAVAFFVMILSLNLQGYIKPNPHTQGYTSHPFYFAKFAALSEEGALFDAMSDYNSLLPVVLHAVSIFTLNTLYRSVARKLTKWENHETQQSHDQSLILKRFLFEAFDCYIVLFYLAFYERDVDRLRVELVNVFNIDSFRRLGTEVLLPQLMLFFWSSKSAEDDLAHPYDLHLEVYEPFDDYMEVLIQFGYVVLFASAYPLASLLMAGALWLEIRTDSYKLAYLCQKPAECLNRMSDIGVWKRILTAMVWCSCGTNCLLFGYTSDQMMHYLPDFYIRDRNGITHMVHDKGWIAMLVIFGLERALLLIGLALHTFIPAVPEHLAIQRKRRAFLLTRQSKKDD